jgi:hypothetical protein
VAGRQQGFRASARHTDVRHSQGAQATDSEDPQAGSCQPAKDGNDQSGRWFLNSIETRNEIRACVAFQGLSAPFCDHHEQSVPRTFAPADAVDPPRRAAITSWHLGVQHRHERIQTSWQEPPAVICFLKGE